MKQKAINDQQVDTVDPNVSDSPHRRRARVVQSYSPDGAHIYLISYPVP